MKNYRYPGAQPFSKDQSHVFFGREQEIDELYEQITVEDVLVFLGKSGLGKSSLLNAGLTRKMEHANSELFPISIRIGAYSDALNLSPLEKVKNALKSEDFPFVTPKNHTDFLTNDDSLWHVVKHILFKMVIGGRADDSSLRFNGLLLVFDQFEELFTFPKFQIEAFGNALSEVLYTQIPQRFRTELLNLINTENSEKREYVDWIHSDMDIRFIFTVRSDKISLLNELKLYIPSILKNCYELKPLSRENARQAILEPASQDGDFISPSFQLEQSTIDDILLYLTNIGKQPVESFQLQILCQYMEELVIQRNITKIRNSDIEELETIYENYYDNQVKTLKLNELDEEKVYTLFEDGLIFESEKRRLSLYEGEIVERFEISKDILSKLIQSRLLRREADTKGGFTYEISHDSLVVPILIAKEKRAHEREIMDIQKREEEQKRELARLEKENEMERQYNSKIKRLAKTSKKRFYIASVLLILSLISLVFAFFSYNHAQDALSREKETKVNNMLGFAKLNVEQDPTLSFRLAEYIVETKKKGVKDAEKILIETYNSSTSLQFYDEVVVLDGTNEHQIIQVAMSFDERYIAVATDNHKILLYDLLKPEDKHAELSKRHLDKINHLSFSANGRYLLSSSDDSSCIIWDLETKKIHARLEEHTDAVNSAFFSSNGDRIITSSDDFTVKLWDISGKALSSNSIHNGEVFYSNFVSDVKVITASKDGSVGLFEVTSDDELEFIHHTSGNGAGLSSFYFDEVSGIATLTFTSGSIFILNATTNRWINDPFTGGISTQLGENVTCANYLYDQKKIIAAGENGDLTLHDRNSGEKLVIKAHEAEIRDVIVSIDQKYFLTTSDDQLAKLWSINGELLKAFSVKEGVIHPPFFSAKTDFLITATENKVQKWHFKKRGSIVLEGAINIPIIAAHFLEKDKVITANKNGIIEIWDQMGEKIQSFQSDLITDVNTAALPPETVKEEYKNCIAIGGKYCAEVYRYSDTGFHLLRRFEHADRGEITSLSFTGDGLFLMSSSSNGSVYAWRTDGVDIKHYLDSEYITKGVWGVNPVEYNGAPHYSLVTPDHKLWLIEPSRNPIKVLNSTEAERFISVVDNDYGDRRINYIELSKNRKYLLTAAEDRLIRIYSIADDFKLTHKLKGHFDGVIQARFSSDGKYVVSCSDDGSVKVWEIDSHEVVLNLMFKQDKITFVCLSADNKFLLLGNDRGESVLRPIELKIEDILDAVNLREEFGKVYTLSTADKFKYGID